MMSYVRFSLSACIHCDVNVCCTYPGNDEGQVFGLQGESSGRSTCKEAPRPTSLKYFTVVSFICIIYISTMTHAP